MMSQNIALLYYTICKILLIFYAILFWDTRYIGYSNEYCVNDQWELSNLIPTCWWAEWIMPSHWGRDSQSLQSGSFRQIVQGAESAEFWAWGTERWIAGMTKHGKGTRDMGHCAEVFVAWWRVPSEHSLACGEDLQEIVANVLVYNWIHNPEMITLGTAATCNRWSSIHTPIYLHCSA